jgi:hypothetical protein
LLLCLDASSCDQQRVDGATTAERWRPAVDCVRCCGPRCATCRASDGQPGYAAVAWHHSPLVAGTMHFCQPLAKHPGCDLTLCAPLRQEIARLVPAFPGPATQPATSVAWAIPSGCQSSTSSLPSRPRTRASPLISPLRSGCSVTAQSMHGVSRSPGQSRQPRFWGGHPRLCQPTGRWPVAAAAGIAARTCGWWTPDAETPGAMKGSVSGRHTTTCGTQPRPSVGGVADVERLNGQGGGKRRTGSGGAAGGSSG